MRPLALLLLAGCAIDTGINKTPGDPAADTGDTGLPTDTDTDTGEPPDTDETGGPRCDDASFPPADVDPVAACEGGEPVGTFTPVIEWANSEVGSSYSAPVVGQLTDDDGDGRIGDGDTPDIVVIDTGGRVWAVSGDGRTLWSSSVVASAGTAAIGDLDGDGFPEVLAGGSWATYALHGEDGSVYWTGEGVPEVVCGASAIADLDADGDPEGIVGRVIFDGQTGRVRGRGAYGSGTGFNGGGAAATGAAADIDRDGLLEVVVGNALYDADGNTIWSNGQPDGFVAVADFDGDPEGEIVVTGGGRVRLQDDDGSVIWSGSYVGSTAGPPTVADFDGDGEPEIGVAGHGQYMVIDTDGTTLWSRPTNDASSGFTGSSVFDFEGDGAAEVVYADEQDVFVFDGATGAVKLREPTHSSATCSEYPTIADVDNDGHAEIIYTSNPYAGSETGIRVIGDAADSWRPGRKVWNQFAYNITNVAEDGTIPVEPDANWDSYNNFRSGDMTAGTGGAGLADLFPHVHDVCLDECGAGRVTVWLSLGNQGYADVTDPVTVEVWGETDAGRVLLHSLDWTGALPQGRRSPSVAVEFAFSGRLNGLSVGVDGGDAPSAGTVVECDEDNNVVDWSEAVCP